VELIHLAQYRSMRLVPVNRIIALVSIICGKFIEKLRKDKFHKVSPSGIKLKINNT